MRINSRVWFAISALLIPCMDAMIETRRISVNSPEEIAEFQKTMNMVSGPLNAVYKEMQMIGPFGEKPGLADHNLQTYEDIWLKNGHIRENMALGFSRTVNIEKILFYIGDVPKKFLNKQFDVFVSMDIYRCGNKENLLNSVPIAKGVYFNETKQAIEISFGGKSVLANFVSFANVNHHDVKNSVAYTLRINEIVVIGTYVNQRMARREKMKFQREKDVPLPAKYNFPRTIPDLWPNTTDVLPTHSYTKIIVPFGLYTACVFACFFSCNTAVGITNEGKGTRYAISTNSDLMDRYITDKNANEAVKNLLNWLCPECPLVINELPDKAQPGKLLVLQIKTGIIEGNSDKIIKLLKEGQSMIFVRQADWRHITTPEVDKIFDFMKIFYTNLITKRFTAYQQCSYLNNGARDMTNYDTFVGSWQDVALVHRNLNLNAPAGHEILDRVPENGMDYLIMWKKYDAICKQHRSTEEMVNLFEGWRLLYEKRVGRSSFFPGTGFYPTMADPDAPKDAVMIDVASFKEERLSSALVGASTNEPFAYKVVKQIGRSGMRIATGSCTTYPLGTGRTRFPTTRNPAPDVKDGLNEANWVFTHYINFVTVWYDNQGTTEDGFPIPTHTFTALSGVYRTAAWIYKHPNRKEIWEKSRQRTYFSKFESTGDRVYQCLELERVYDSPFDNWMVQQHILESWVKIDWNYCCNRNPYDSLGEGFNYDIEGIAWMLAGYPVLAYVGAEISGYNNLTQGDWAHAHELGHNIDPSEISKLVGPPQNWPFLEVTPNVLVLVDYMLTGVPGPWNVPGTRCCNVDALVRQWKKKCPLTCEYDAAAAYFCYFTIKFGLGLNGNAIQHAVNSREMSGFSNLERYDWALTVVSGIDMSPYHRFFGFEVSDAMANITRSISSECWLPKDDEYADQVKLEVEEFEKKIGRNCTAKPRQIVPVVAYDKYVNVTDPRVDNFLLERRHISF